MQKAKKICCRITPRRVMGAVLLAAIVVNLITVGAVFKATVPETTPTDAETQTLLTKTFVVLTATEGNTSTFTLTPTETATQTPTFTATDTPTATSTETVTSTFTNTPSPSPTLCFPKYEWPVYIVQPGDWLLAIARATGSSDYELRRVNCLIDSDIYPGQPLHVPRLPVTAIVTTAAPTDTPADFKLSTMLNCDPQLYFALSVIVSDPQGVQAVTVAFYTKDGALIDAMTMKHEGDTYYAADSLKGNYTVYDIDHYNFIARDNLQNGTVSQPYYDRSRNCELQFIVSPTPTAESPVVFK